MTYEQFQRHFEQKSDKVYEELSKLNEDKLLKIIHNKYDLKYRVWKGGDNYQIWRVLGFKGTTKSIQPLFDIVSNLKNNYLIRYHACEALFSIAKLNDKELMGKVQYGKDRKRMQVDQSKAIQELGQLLNIETFFTGEKAKTSWWKFWKK